MVHTARLYLPLVPAVLALVALVALVAPGVSPAPRHQGDAGYIRGLLREGLRKDREERRLAEDDRPARDDHVNVNELDTIFQRIRKQAPPAVRCGGGSGRNPYECNDGLMGVWLRLMKNPDYSD